MNCKAKGNRNEYKTMRLLEAVGYECFRMAASKGAFAVIAVSPSAFEMETIKAFDCPPNARKLIHVWQDRKCLPLVKEV